MYAIRSYYATPRGRYDHMPELVDGIDAALAARSRDEWGAIFDANGIISYNFV